MVGPLQDDGPQTAGAQCARDRETAGTGAYDVHGPARGVGGPLRFSGRGGVGHAASVIAASLDGSRSRPESVADRSRPGPVGLNGRMAHTHMYTLDPSLSRTEPRGHGLRLRAWDAASDDDAQTWLRGCLDPSSSAGTHRSSCGPISPGPASRSGGRARDAADGRSASFRITDDESGTTLGHIGLKTRSHRQMKVARIGYWVLPEARGRGVATGALLLASRWSYAELGLHRLELGHAVGREDLPRHQPCGRHR
ncbi:hypothetical protein STENM327S_02656 [Streptomyces tendae]